MQKNAKRVRRASRARSTIKRLGVARLSVHRTPRHIYAQLFTHDGAKVIVSASTLDAEVKKADFKHGGNVAAATTVGKHIAQRALAAGVSEVAFDRGGFKYHGRIKALADAAREAGLNF